MARTPRQILKRFADTAGPDQIAIFGSLAESSPTFSTSVSGIQSMPPWTEGWFSAIIGNNSPTIEDMNALFFVITYQLFYLLEAGVPEWNASTTYYSGDVVNLTGQLYVSRIDTNLNNSPTAAGSRTNWAMYGMTSIQTFPSGTPTITAADQIFRSTHSSGVAQWTLPAVADCPLGKTFTLKKAGAGTLQIIAAGAELIDGAAKFTMAGVPLQTLVVYNNGTGWDIQ